MDKILPDLIVSWPRHMDYPLWRQQIHDNRNLFTKIIIVFTNMNVRKDYRDFVKVAMKDDNITFIENGEVAGDSDWRNESVNAGLRKSKAPWVWFTEQDFFWKDGFWELLDSNEEAFSVMSVSVQERMHPCSILVRRDVIEQTRKDFSVTKDKLDHFGKFQEDIDVLHCAKLAVPEHLYIHMGGLSQNMFMMHDKTSALYFPEEFEKYVWKCLDVSVPLHQDFVIAFRKYLEKS